MFDHAYKVSELFFDRRWFLRCRVNILIVTDSSSGGFGSAGFHLGEILNVLGSDPWSWVQFHVTKAHRGVDPAGDVIDNFRFNTHDLSGYSQIWLFGIERSANPLSAAELRALSEFMEAGGGVFATGDHEDLGRAMCAEVPRVRSMRRWYYPNAGPNGEPVAPSQSGSDRHDTVILPGNQSDQVPQPIRPRYYTRRANTILKEYRYPHPVLCGPDGVITYLPDHMHEGLCEVPSNLSQTYTFDGLSVKEYPDTTDGHANPPEVIAWATTRNTDGDEFGVLAAWDGHRSGGRGRVLVDATWHHWFNINLTGFVANAGDPVVGPKWQSIQAYFRNVALWLARPTLQECLRNGGWLIATHYYDILITYQPLDRVKNHYGYFTQLGIFARDAMGRLASQCQRTQWTIDWSDFFEIEFNPWWRWPRPDPPPWLDPIEFETIVAGGIVHALLEKFGAEKEPGRLMNAGKDLQAVASEGARASLRALFERYENAGRQAAAFSKRLAR